MYKAIRKEIWGIMGKAGDIYVDRNENQKIN